MCEEYTPSLNARPWQEDEVMAQIQRTMDLADNEAAYAHFAHWQNNMTNTPEVDGGSALQMAFAAQMAQFNEMD